MTFSDSIQLVGILLTAATSFIAIVISIKTLKQNSKMIEDQARPYLVIYDGVTNCESVRYYLILKNFGQSAAILKSIQYDIDLFENARNPFLLLENTLIAPGQSFYIHIRTEQFLKIRKASFTIDYSWENKKFREIFPLNFHSRDNIASVRSSKNASNDLENLKHLKVISYSLQDMIEKLL